MFGTASPLPPCYANFNQGERGRGIGSALFRRAVTCACHAGVHTLQMNYQSRNGAMRQIASRAGMTMQYAYGEVNACLELPPADLRCRWDPITVATTLLGEPHARAIA
jgi:L-amino acid N-acyltransferase YncA